MFTGCRIPALTLHTVPRSLALPRSISSSPPVLAGRKKKGNPAPVISKKKQQAKERKRELKDALKKKSIYDDEKMTLSDAIHVLRAVEVAHPNATYELVIKTLLGRNSAVPRGRISLPYAPKPAKADRILVFAEGRAADDAKRAGADIVGGAELVDGVLSGRHHANLILSTPGLVRTIAPRLGRVLGPRGLMPTERRGTVTEDPAGFIKKLQGSNEWKGDKAGTIRTPIGKMDFPVQNIIQNVRHFIDAVKKEMGNTADGKGDLGLKGRNAFTHLRRVVLSSQQGPGITISDI